MTQPDLSVVVIGRNEGSRLTRCLQSVLKVRERELQIELIYVDSGSADGSPETAAALGADVVRLQAGQPTAAMGRNAGWQRAHAPFVLFLDGDTVLDPEFPQMAMKALSLDDDIAVVWGHRREIHPERSIYNRILDLDWIYPLGETPFCGGDALMRRSILADVQGYDASLIAGEEPELCRRLRARGFRVLHIDQPMTGHDLAILHWHQYWRRAMRTGYAYAEIAHRFRATPDPLWREESRKHMIRGIFWVGSSLVVLLALFRSSIPLVVWLVAFFLLSLRSAWKARWKAPGNFRLMIAYGIHSHLQQIPILMGQAMQYWDRRRGKRRGLIDYKEAAGT